jgi:hypothetical protein
MLVVSSPMAALALGAALEEPALMMMRLAAKRLGPAMMAANR